MRSIFSVIIKVLPILDVAIKRVYVFGEKKSTSTINKIINTSKKGRQLFREPGTWNGNNRICRAHSVYIVCGYCRRTRLSTARLSQLSPVHTVAI
jgi:hypothetical protein